jgi:hypothetical protein
VNGSGWPTLNKLSIPAIPKCNGLKTELSSVCGCVLRLRRPCPALLNPAIKDQNKMQQQQTRRSRNNQHTRIIVTLLYSIYRLLHVSAVVCHHQGASWIHLSYLKCR